MIKKNVVPEDFLKRIYIYNLDSFLDMVNFLLKFRSELGTWTNSEKKLCFGGSVGSSGTKFICSFFKIF